MIKNNINQFIINGTVKLAPATNHVIQSIFHEETGDLIVYTNRVFPSEKSFSNNLVDFIKYHMHEEGRPTRRLLIITPSFNGSHYLKRVIDENGFENVSVYLTKIITTNYIIEKKNVLFGVENFLEHSSTNSPSVTIIDSQCRSFFVNYSKELLKQSIPIVKHSFDEEMFR